MSAPTAVRAPAIPSRALRPLAVLLLAAGLHGAALASPASDIAELKKALAAMKSDYDKRIGALESQLHDTQAELAQAKASAPESNHRFIIFLKSGKWRLGADGNGHGSIHRTRTRIGHPNNHVENSGTLGRTRQQTGGGQSQARG